MILLYVHALAATGVVRNVRLLAADLAARGRPVRIVTALPGGEGAAGVDHVALMEGALRRRGQEKLRAVAALRGHLRAAGPATLVSMGNHGHMVAWAASRGLASVRRIYRISNDLVRTAPGAPGGRLERVQRALTARALARDAYRLVLVSPTLADMPAFAAARDRAVVIANGIDAQAARRRAGEAVELHPWLHDGMPVLLAIGRLAPQKNFGTLLAAFAQARRAGPARLVILGESRDDARDRLMRRADVLGIAADVALPGAVANVFPWLAAADAFILPSWWEGAPNVLLEAMAVGTPVIASRSAGNAADLLDGGRHGLLVDPADAAAMAGAIRRQLDPMTRLYPGDRIAAFGARAMLDAWAALLDG